MFYYSALVPLFRRYFRTFKNSLRAKEEERTRERKEKGSETFSFFFSLLLNFQHGLCLWEILCLSPRTLLFIAVSSPSSLAEFSTHTRRKRTRKMFAHALDRPVCHDGDSLHPSTPQLLSTLPCMSHPSHLSSSITPSPLRLHPPLSIFLSHAHAQVSSFFLLSLFSRRNPSPPLFDAGIPAKTICQDAGRGNCKASSTLFNLKIQCGFSQY